MKKLITSFILISFLFPHGGKNDRKIEFPDLPGLKTLVCDLHMPSRRQRQMCIRDSLIHELENWF